MPWGGYIVDVGNYGGVWRAADGARRLRGGRACAVAESRSHLRTCDVM